MKKRMILLIVFISILGLTANLSAHCQIPCGIYDDEVRLSLLEEHVTTIEKSMNQVIELSKAEAPDWNQLVRWVNNKDDHADQFTEIVTAYFMAQRIKPVEKGDDGYDQYQQELEWLHHMVVYAMKAKQTVDLKHVEKLRQLVRDFRLSYLGTDTDHMKEHQH